MIDPEVSRRALEPALFKMKEKAVQIVGVGVHWPTNCVADSYDAGRRHPAEEGHFLA